MPADRAGDATSEEPASVHAPSPQRSSLARKIALAFIGLVAAVLVINGAIDMFLAWRDAEQLAVQTQQEKADSTAERVAQFISEIERQMGWTTRAEWSRVTAEQRRYDFIRLLRQAPAITEAIQVDGQGREQLKLSRLEPDAIGSNIDLSDDPRVVGALRDRVWYGPVTFRRGSEPYMAIGLAHAGRNTGATIAEINLKLAWDVVMSIRVGQSGYAFVTDRSGRLIAHPDMSLVLRGTDLSHLPQVAAAVRDLSDGIAERVRVLEGASVTGQKELSAYAPVPSLGWIVFVDLPRGEAVAPVLKAMYQTLSLMALGIILAAAAGALLAGRIAAPIRALQSSAQRLGDGDLSQRALVTTGDEIGELASRFNVMASRIQDAQETLERRVEERTTELTRSLADLRAAQDRLIQTEKLASLGQLTAGIAHEIKNPLNFVNNFAAVSAELVNELREELAALDIDAAKRKEFEGIAELLTGNLGKVISHGNRADSIVKNMLLHSRSGSGDRSEIDVNALVEETINLAYHGARAEKPGFNVTIERDLDAAAGRAELFPQEMARVFLNLIGNAFHATAQRKATSSVPYEPTVRVMTVDRGHWVEIAIRDNGIGIEEGLKKKIFEPFFTTKPVGEGTGLGLSLSHDIVTKQHAGRLEVSSRPLEFTEFSIVVPRTSAARQ
jgi:two-component system NtrC family sensor kinase